MALNPMAQAYQDKIMNEYNSKMTPEELAEIEAACTDSNGNIDPTQKLERIKYNAFSDAGATLAEQADALETASYETYDAAEYDKGYAHALEFGGDDKDLEKYGLDGSTALNTYTDHTKVNEKRIGFNEQIAAITGNDEASIEARTALETQRDEIEALKNMKEASAAKLGAEYEQMSAQLDVMIAEKELAYSMAIGSSEETINKQAEAWAEKQVAYFDKYESNKNPQNAADAKAYQDYNKFIDSLRGDKPAEAEAAAPEKTEPAKTEPEAKETVTETKTVEAKEYNAKPEPEETGEVKEMTEADKKAYIEETEKLMEEGGGNLRVNSADDAKRAQERMSNYAQYKEDLGIVDENAKPDPYKMSADFKGTQEEWNAQVNKEAAQSVIRGDYGNGIERANALKEAGYDAAAVQTVVNTDMAKINAEKQAAEIAKTKEQLASGNTEKASVFPSVMKQYEITEEDIEVGRVKVFEMEDGSTKTQLYNKDGKLAVLAVERDGYQKQQLYREDGTLAEIYEANYDTDTGHITKEIRQEREADGKTPSEYYKGEYDENGIQTYSCRKLYHEGEVTYRGTYDNGVYEINRADGKGGYETEKYTQEEWDKMHGFNGTQEGFSAGQEGFEAAGISEETQTVTSERKSLDDQIENNNEGDMLERKQADAAAESEYPKLLESGKYSPTGTYKCYDMGDGYVQTQYYGADGKLDTMVKNNEEKGTSKVQMYDDAGECRYIKDTVYDKETNKLIKETIEERDENGITTSKEIFDGETYHTQTFDKDGNVISDTKETVAERKAREAEQEGFKPKEEPETEKPKEEKPKEQESGKTQGQTPFIPETPSQGQTPFTPKTTPKGQGGVETGDETNLYINPDELPNNGNTNLQIDTNELPNKGNTNLQINMKRFDTKVYQGSNDTQSYDNDFDPMDN